MIGASDVAAMVAAYVRKPLSHTGSIKNLGFTLLDAAIRGVQEEERRRIQAIVEKEKQSASPYQLQALERVAAAIDALPFIDDD